MEKKEKKPLEKPLEKQTSWFDKLNYSLMWQQLLYKATLLRIDGKDEQYMVSVDAIIRTLLKSDRETVKTHKKELLDGLGYGLEHRMGVYDELFESIVDRLEDSGYLTKEFITMTYTSDLGEYGDTSET